MSEVVAKALELSGGREQVSADLINKLIAEWTVRDPLSLRLSNKSFSVEAAEVMATFLDSLEASLRIADISDIIASRPEEEALQALRVLCAALKRFPLVEVNLSDNALGAKGIDACKDVLLSKNLERLFLCNIGLSAEGATLLADLLLKDLSPPPLETLHFYNNMSGDGGAQAAARLVTALPGLRDFRFSATRSHGDGCLALAEAIGSKCLLQRLDLSDNSFGKKASAALGKSISKLSALEFLNLRDDGLIVEDLLGGLRGCRLPQLVVLDLSGNDIESSTCAALADWLPRAAPALQRLLLDDNDLEWEGAKVLARSCRSLSALQVLSCCCCSLQGRAALRLARELVKLSAFQKLEIDGNSLSTEAVKTLGEMLHAAGKQLGDLEENDEDGDDEEEDDEDEEEEQEVEEEQDGEAELLAAELSKAQISS